jgi:signal transduction histidine kinase
MMGNSIRIRLLLAAGITIILVLIAAGFGITQIFQRHLEKRVKSELDKQIIQLLASIEVKDDGKIRLSKALADPRFTLPLSGLYWQIDLGEKAIARSVSLADEELEVPAAKVDAIESQILSIAGPNGQKLYAIEQAVYLESLGQEKIYTVAVGLERGEINDTVLSMRRDVAPALTALGLLMLLATWIQVSLGLRPLSVIKQALHDIREGGKGRVNTEVAEEVKPLVNELNALLAANEERNRLERQRAADLAHGLRTPLTILGSIARNLELAGLKTEAEKIGLQTEHMRQQVERELARALSSVEDVPVLTDVFTSVNRLVSVVAMAAINPNFIWEVEIPKTVQWRITRNDFHEMLGNILENAQKWGISKARVRWQENALWIEDDGPGVASNDRYKLTERGYTTSGDQTSTGLGLAIVQQIADKNEIALAFEQSELGGLLVRLNIPQAQLSAVH